MGYKMWIIDYYETTSGRCPTKDFLLDQNAVTERPVIMNALDQLEKEGNKLDYPHVKNLGDGIYELRIRIQKKRYRFFYFFFKKNTIVITHGITKKKSEVTQHQIDLAKTYRENYSAR